MRSALPLWNRLAFVVGLGFTVLTADLSSAEVIDQFNRTGTVVEASIGIVDGQTFRPQLDHIDFVRFKFMTMMSSGTPTPSSIFVRLHAGDRNGPLLGQTDPVVMDGVDPRILEFRFASSIPLVPDSMYTFIVVDTSGRWGIAVTMNTYPPGQIVSICCMDPEHYDAWFVEGVDVVPVRPASWGRVKSAYRGSQAVRDSHGP